MFIGMILAFLFGIVCIVISVKNAFKRILKVRI